MSPLQGFLWSGELGWVLARASWVGLGWVRLGDVKWTHVHL